MASCVQEGLQEDAGGGGVEHRLALAPALAAGLGELGLGGDRGQALVDAEHRQGVAAVELVGEAAAARGELVLAAVEVGGDADHQRDRAPFGYQPGDGGEAFVVRLGVKRGERAGQAGLELAAGDADAGEAEVEAEDGAARGESVRAGRGGAGVRKGRGGRSRLRHVRRHRSGW